MLHDLVTLFDRDLDRLTREIASFREEDHLWQIRGNVKNSAGNLCLHLMGNLDTYIGKNLGDTDYVRNREAEFSQSGIPQEMLLEQLARTRATVNSVLRQLSESELAKTYPENVLSFPPGQLMTTGFFLIHLLAHLSYHLGQINYLRRILE